MSLDRTIGRPSLSAEDSGRSSPAPRALRRTADDGLHANKVDKNIRRYAATIERALQSWEISPQEWADYIAFLGRLLKAIQTHPHDVSILPHVADVSSKLSQCLIPTLPSGVHQKAIEVYSYIFSIFGRDYVAINLHHFLPGLSTVLAFASLSVRPALYKLFEDYIIRLPAEELRPALKSLILSLLPALEDENGEDFERAFAILETLQKVFSGVANGASDSTEDRGSFWQCLFLSIITSASRRQGALNYLTRQLPKLGRSQATPGQPPAQRSNMGTSGISPMAEAVISPEPGLLIRSFVSGLSDPQILIQRGFLDLLVSHLPLNASVLQRESGEQDLDYLVSAAAHVLLRRDMSLNRRLWSWFLGPETEDGGQSNKPTENPDIRKSSNESRANNQYQYFAAYGRKSLERSILAMFHAQGSKASEMARPFRICLSLMDRGEIGGTLVPSVFLPGVHCVFSYSRNASPEDVSEVLRSASLFFDGIEANLIWANLLKLLCNADKVKNASRAEDLRLFAWIVTNFNVKDEEMLMVHLPYSLLYLVSIIGDTSGTPPSIDTVSITLDSLSNLLSIIPQRAFIFHQSNTESRTNAEITMDITNPNSKSIKEIVTKFYEGVTQEATMGMPITRQSSLSIFKRLLESLVVQFLESDPNEFLGQATSLLLMLSGKVPSPSDFNWDIVSWAIIKTFQTAAKAEAVLPFTTLSSTIAIATAIALLPQQKSPNFLRHVEPNLIAQLWRYLSPFSPKYHVEAVKLLWQLEDLMAPQDCVEATLTGLVSQSTAGANRCHENLAEAAECFSVLWSHTIPTASSTVRSAPLGVSRRGNALSTTTDPKQLNRRERILTEPLMLVLDALSEPDEGSFRIVRNWLVGLPNLDRILRIHFDRLLDITLSTKQTGRVITAKVARRKMEDTRDLEYLMDHFLLLLKHSMDNTCRALQEMTMNTNGSDAKTGLVLLAEICIQTLCSDRFALERLDHLTIDILSVLFNSPVATMLKPLNIDIDIIERLAAWLSRREAPLQGMLLTLLNSALKVRLMHEQTYSWSERRRRSSIGNKRPSSAGIRSNSTPSNAAHYPVTAAPPPSQLMTCLRLGFSSKASRPHLDEWLEFLTDILPLFVDTLISHLIPLVECLCQELRKSHKQLLTIARKDGGFLRADPESEAMGLIEGLEIVLARAHECLASEGVAESTPKPFTSSQNLLSNVASGVFKTDGAQSKGSQSNSRLTVILALQDAIKISIELWTWASHNTEVANFDKNSAATTAFIALRLRNRTRHLLEQIFTVELLESLEVAIAQWCHAEDANVATAAIDLLHVMQGSRPKIVMPAILDALCSRTNQSALPAHRQSSLTVDLSPLDIALFLSAYTDSIEDDAMDEVYSDCVVFWKDVLGNPLPYRQVLPALLSMILLVAQKIENTNFGEQRKMRRELGDIFQRLLTATFTAIPSGYVIDLAEVAGKVSLESNSIRGTRMMGLVPVLVRVVTNVDTLLETSERAAAAINTISTSLIGPLFHAKSFPRNISSETLTLLLQMAKKAPTARSWKKDLSDAFNDARFLTSPPDLVQSHWFPLLHQWSLYDKERMPELLSRLAPPSTAGIMFGVGANAARLDADRKTQLNLRRICLLLLSSAEDTFVAHLRTFGEKLVELFDASVSSSPSSAVKAELFMLCRAITLSTSSAQLSPIWPIVNSALQQAFISLLPQAADNASFSNLTLFQACKLLDLLVVLAPDEFQLHEWLYISDTIDAVYKPSDWNPSALADQITESLAIDRADDGPSTTVVPVVSGSSGSRRLLITNEMEIDKEDWKAMAREDFARSILRPFFSQLSLSAYEGVYSLDMPDLKPCCRSLLEDLLDLSTIVD